MMVAFRLSVLTAVLASLAALGTGVSGDVTARVPARAPRTAVLAGRQEAFRAYCTTGAGAKAFAKIKADFDHEFAGFAVPSEPLTYGDPDPKQRDSAKADRWRDVQDVCGRVAGVAEAATLIWLVTGEEKYFAKAKEILLQVSAWH